MLNTISHQEASFRIAAPSEESSLRRKAMELEAVFLAEMLKHAGLGETSKLMGGGLGEEQFASLLREHQSAAIVEKGGIGLAEQIYLSLKAAHDAHA